ncbi:MAG: hypothetical protein ACLPSH_03780 [Vulcanimicrobiaceae bacterium]
MKRQRFLELAAAAPALASCSSSSPSVPSQGGIPAAPLLSPGTKIPDLRYGKFTLPAAFPGYDPAGDAAALVLNYVSPATAPVPGTLATGSYAVNERYVIKVPAAWNGKLIVAGTPATRSEFANEGIWGDFALAGGYAFASSNKGIDYNAILETLSASPNPNRAYPIPFDYTVPLTPPLKLESDEYTYRLGVLNQGGTIANWNTDYATLVRAAQQFLLMFFGKAPTRTYAVGTSNGGAQVRSLLENYGSLVDGGVDWEGVYWSPSMNLFTYMPKFLAAMQTYVASGFKDTAAAAAIEAAGYPADIAGAAGHPSLWYEYYANQPSFYADLTVFVYALFLDPAATSSLSAPGCAPNPTNPVGLPGTCNATGLAVPANRASYVPSSQAANVISTFQHTGNIQKPLISIAGSDDVFVTAANNAIPYLNAVKASGKGSQYWQYLVQGGTHVDTFANPAWGYGLQPQLFFAWAAFNQLVAIVEHGLNPAGSGAQQPVSTPSQIVST